MKTMHRRFVTLGVAVLVAGSFLGSPADAAPEKKPTIAQIAIAVNAETGEFSTLIAALQYAGLVDVLNGKKQFTVFAPTDEAFKKLGLDAESIVELPKDVVTDILLYHVAHGKRASQSVISARQIRMLNGDFALIGEGPSIDGAGFLATDLKARNGIIHVVDSVLLPPE